MRLRSNLLAGVIGSAWGAVLSFAVVPIYLASLGIDTYGLIGIFATAQVFFSLLDLGLAPAISREIAKVVDANDLMKARVLLHTSAVIYVIVAMVVMSGVFLAAPHAAKDWFRSGVLTPSDVESSLVWMGVAAACRWPIGVYQAALLGTQRQVTLAKINGVGLTASALGGVFVLTHIAPSLPALMIWQSVVSVVQVIFLRSYAWAAIGGGLKAEFSISSVMQVRHFSMGMWLITLTAIVLSQSDRLILSGILDLRGVGHYFLAGSVVATLNLLVLPVFNSVSPVFTQLVKAKRPQKLKHLYRVTNRLLASMLFSMAMMLFLASDSLLFIWTGDRQLASDVGPIVSIMVLGAAMHGVMYVPYALQLAHGATRMAIAINIFLISTTLPLTYFLTTYYGLLGAAFAWTLFCTSYFIIGTCCTSQFLLSGKGGVWMIRDAGAPFAINLLIAFVGRYLIIDHSNLSSYSIILVAGVLGLTAMWVSLLIAPHGVKVLVKAFRSKNLEVASGQK